MMVIFTKIKFYEILYCIIYHKVNKKSCKIGFYRTIFYIMCAIYKVLNCSSILISFSKNIRMSLI